MHCTLGAKNSKLTVTSQTFRRIADALVGTDGEHPKFQYLQMQLPKSTLYSSTPRMAANNTERQHQWNEKTDGAVILYVC